MMSASQLLFARIDLTAPASTSEHESEPCWVCAAPSVRGVSVADWLGATFVGQNRVRSPDSAHVCAACVAVMAGRPPDTMRMYSWLVDDRGVLKFNKGNKREMRDWLREPKAGPWFAAIADSGQKHVIPWSPMNAAGTRRGVVMFEETAVTIPVDHAAGWTLVDRMTTLLTAGATKEEIGRGEYGQGTWQRCTDEVRRFEDGWSEKRHSPWFSLALWLAQRDEETVAKRLEEEKAARAAKKEAERDRRSAQGKTKKRNGRPTIGSESGIPVDAARERAETLGTTAGPYAGRGAHDGGAGGVGDNDRPAAPAIGAQCSIFDLLAPADAPSPRKRMRK